MAEDQTRMAFMSDADEKFDPVSGNDVPPGSLPEEVRDDIDARLSEGEYVVPADVVRFFGVKFFEDLRTQAKRGLSSMEEDGRIGGEPVSDDLEAMQMDQEIDAMIAVEMNGMAEGGEVKQYALGGLEEGKNDELVKGVLDMVQQQPALQQMLATKGLKINTTGANNIGTVFLVIDLVIVSILEFKKGRTDEGRTRTHIHTRRGTNRTTKGIIVILACTVLQLPLIRLYSSCSSVILL